MNIKRKAPEIRKPSWRIALGFERLRLWIVVGLFVAGLAFILSHVLRPQRAARLEVIGVGSAHIQAKMMRTARENERLSHELAQLEEGAEGWHKLARHHYGMVLEGEVVYRFPEAVEAEVPIPSPILRSSLQRP